MDTGIKDVCEQFVCDNMRVYTPSSPNEVSLYSRVISIQIAKDSRKPLFINSHTSERQTRVCVFAVEGERIDFTRSHVREREDSSFLARLVPTPSSVSMIDLRISFGIHFAMKWE